MEVVEVESHASWDSEPRHAVAAADEMPGSADGGIDKDLNRVRQGNGPDAIERHQTARVDGISQARLVAESDDRVRPRKRRPTKREHNPATQPVTAACR